MEERRKVQKLGRTTLVVSLPKEWVDSHGIKNGDMLVVNYTPESEHVVVRKDRKMVRECFVKFDRNVEWVVREIVAKYVQGYDKIEVTGLDSWDVLKKIKSSVESILFGIDLLEENNKLIIKVMVGPEKMNLEDMISRCCASILWMISSLIEAIIKNDASLLRDVVQRDDDLDKMVLLARRQLNIKGYESFPSMRTFIKLFGYSSVLQKLESVGDCLESIATHTIQIMEKAELSHLLQQPLNRLAEIIKKIPLALGENDRNLANYVVDESTRYSKVDLENLRENLSVVPADIRSDIANITENLSRISQSTKEIGEVILDSFI